VCSGPARLLDLICPAVGSTKTMARVLLLGAFGCLAIILGGCVADAPLGASVDVSAPAAKVDDAGTTPTIQNPGDVKYYPSDEPLRLGQEYFNRGIFGVAQQYFQAAVEKAPRDASAWVGLAASYDRLGRFDLADRAYREAIKLQGETTQILNNQGYSYMLRGKLSAAREKFKEAFQREPDNPTIENNINLLNGSYRFIQRDPQ
jgi:Flp pilus assembly protein TadD